MGPPPRACGPTRAHRPAGHMGPPKRHSPPERRDPPSTHRTPGHLGTPRCTVPQGTEDPYGTQTPKVHGPRGCVDPFQGMWDPQAHDDLKQSGSLGLCWGSGNPGLCGGSPGCRRAAVMRVPTLLGRRSRGSRGRERALSSPSPWAGGCAAAGTPGRAGEEGSRDTRSPGGHTASPARPRVVGAHVPSSSTSPQPRRRALREHWRDGTGARGVCGHCGGPWG